MPNSSNETNENEAQHSKMTLPGMRYLFTAMCFFGMSFMFAARCSMSVAIVAMVNHTAVNNNVQTQECPNLIRHPENISDPMYIRAKDGEFNWPPSMQAQVLGSFYYIFSLMQIPGGRFSETFSGKWVFFIGLTISLILTLLIPFSAYNSFHLLILVRMLMGAAQGVCFPAIFNLMGLWFPSTEKSLLQNIVMSGINVGIFITMIVTGFLCNSKILGGWPSVFYLTGLVGLLFCLLWVFLVTDTPKEHPFMSEEELEYITSNQNVNQDLELPSFPWKRALKSRPLWAVVIAQIGIDWCYYTLLNHLPQFFYDILHFDLESVSKIV
nr:sialin [Parasteatoda tepidariorum]